LKPEKISAVFPELPKMPWYYLSVQRIIQNFYIKTFGEYIPTAFTKART